MFVKTNTPKGTNAHSKSTTMHFAAALKKGKQYWGR